MRYFVICVPFTQLANFKVFCGPIRDKIESQFVRHWKDGEPWRTVSIWYMRTTMAFFEPKNEEAVQLLCQQTGITIDYWTDEQVTREETAPGEWKPGLDGVI